MKTFTSILMVIVVIAGFVLAVTPFVAEKLLPKPENVVRQAKPEAAAMALQNWFNSPNDLFTDVQAINKTSANKEKNVEEHTSWFAFSVGRRPVERYIIEHKLQQLPLDEEQLKNTFFTGERPASWWQPEAIDQKTFFTGKHQGRKVSLIYNPNSKRGVLVTTSK